MPSPNEWDVRFGHNMRYWLSNYICIMLVVLVAVVISRPLVLASLAVASGLYWAVSHYLWKHRVSAVIAGQRLTPAHLTLLFVMAVCTVIFILFRSEILTFIGGCASIVSVHALFRNAKPLTPGACKADEAERGAAAPSVEQHS